MINFIIGVMEVVFYSWLAGVIVCFVFLLYLMVSNSKKGKSDLTLQDMGIALAISLFSWVACLILMVVLGEKVIILRKKIKEE
jgi:hypothetical protein